jgi:CheY-like chemotaxis protein
MSSAGLSVLAGRRILVVEDEYFLADDIHHALAQLGAEVVGPVPTLRGALEVLADESRIDAAVLDINLRNERS